MFMRFSHCKSTTKKRDCKIYRQKILRNYYGGLGLMTLFSVQLNRERDQFFSEAVESPHDFLGLFRARF